MVRLKRVYESKSRGDGYRVLVDRLWPRGLKKQEAAVDDWFKNLGPSHQLRKDFGHDPSRWKSFISAYKKELRSPTTKDLLKKLSRRASRGTVTLLYGARDEEHNNAVVLKEVLDKELKKLKH